MVLPALSGVLAAGDLVEVRRQERPIAMSVVCARPSSGLGVMTDVMTEMRLTTLVRGWEIDARNRSRPGEVTKRRRQGRKAG
jgi:hypothetical protein